MTLSVKTNLTCSTSIWLVFPERVTYTSWCCVCPSVVLYSPLVAFRGEILLVNVIHSAGRLIMRLLILQARVTYSSHCLYLYISSPTIRKAHTFLIHLVHIVQPHTEMHVMKSTLAIQLETLNEDSTIKAISFDHCQGSKIRCKSW